MKSLNSEIIRASIVISLASLGELIAVLLITSSIVVLPTKPTMIIEKNLDFQRLQPQKRSIDYRHNNGDHTTHFSDPVRLSVFSEAIIQAQIARGEQ